MSQFIGNTQFDFLAQAKKVIAFFSIVIVIGTYLLVSQHRTIFGMDFTGGYSLTLEVQEKPNINYRVEAIRALTDHGAASNDFEIRELSRPNQLRIQMATRMEEKGHPFYEMPEEYQKDTFAYDYQKNPRITWIVQSLEDAGLHIPKSQLTTLNKNWTVMSGQLSDAMRNNAIIALGFALLSILIYITFRFEFKYAVGAVVSLAFVVAFSVSLLAILHRLGSPVQIDLQVVGALMTIIGYALNDTIIVFDRVREDVKLYRKWKFRDVVNYALNVTLSRTIMTSGTTLVVLLTLVFMGGSSIFAFSLMMTFGVIFGTLASLFIASPVMLYYHNKEAGEPNGEAHGNVGELKKA